MKLKNRIISLLLAIATMLTTINIPIAHATGDGSGNTSATGATSAGTWSQYRTGIRVYIVDQSGQLVSNIVDIVHDENFPTYRGIACLGIRGDGRYQGYPQGDIGAGKILENLDRDSVTIIQESVVSGIDSVLPIQTKSGSKLQGHGEDLRKWMLGSTGKVWEGVSGGGGGSSSSDDEWEYEGENSSTTEDSNLGESVNNIIAELWIKFDVYQKAGTYSNQQLLEYINKDIENIYSNLNKADDSDNPIYTDTQKQEIAAALLQFQLEVKSRLGISEENDNTEENIENTMKLKNNFRSLFDIAYAEETEEQLAKLYEDGGLITLMETKLGSQSLFKFNSASGVTELLKTDKDKESVLLTCQAHNFLIFMEPLFYSRLNKANKDASEYFFYGTVSNYAAYIAEQKANGGWDNGNDTGGNLGSVLHQSLAWSMYTEYDLQTDGGINIKKAESLASNGTRLTDSQLNQTKEYGIALHYYKFKAVEPVKSLPEIPTYDTTKQDPNRSPHSIQNPLSTEDGGTIPLVPGEPQDTYKENTRTIHIVKCYDIEYPDGSIEHVQTFTSDNAPGTIHIMHEPDYKVVEWFSATNYYGDEYDWDAQAKVSPTEWIELKAFVQSKSPYKKEIKDVAGNVTKAITRIQPTDGKEYAWATVKDKDAGTIEETVKLAIACDCNTENPAEGKHYDDNTLYIRLVKQLEKPETSTYDQTTYPDGEPSDPPDPTAPTQPDPETTPVEPGNPFIHYRIVKVYEEEDLDTSTITTVAVKTRYPTAPVIQIEDEPEYKLIEWEYGDEYTPTPASNDWDDIVAPVVPKGSGTTEEKVDITDPGDSEKEVTLYVRLRKTVSSNRAPGDIIIEQSQISKAVHTNDINIGGRWGDYLFIFTVGDFREFHRTNGYNCELYMPGRSGDNEATFIFDEIGEQDSLEISKGTSEETNPKVYSDDGIHKETLHSLYAENNQKAYLPDGRRTNGAEYVTILWRGSTKMSDLPTLAKYKQQDIERVYGEMGYRIPQQMLGNADKISRKTRGSESKTVDLSFTFGLDRLRSDLSVTASCRGYGDTCPSTQTLSFEPLDYLDFTYDFLATVGIQFYAGKVKSLVAEPYGSAVSKSEKTQEIKSGNNRVSYITQGNQEIKFYPYIRMTYMTNDLDRAIGEEENTQATGYRNDVRYDTYVLSEYESSFLPNDAVSVTWGYPKTNMPSLLLSSNQWSLHQKAKDLLGEDSLVLPGGAIYQLETPEDTMLHMYLNTYQTIVDDKARSEYISSTLTGDEYTSKKVTEDHLEFVNIAKEVMDNLNIVQWICADYHGQSASGYNAWPKDFDESAAGSICLRVAENQEKGILLREKLGQDMKGRSNTDSKYFLRTDNKIVYYQGTKLSDKTANIANIASEKITESDLDVIGVQQLTTVYKLFTDTSGNVYIAKSTSSKTEDIQNEIDKLINSMKDINADNMRVGTVTIKKIFEKDIETVEDIQEELSKAGNEEMKEIDDSTKFITNIVTSLTRNKGADKTAEWATSDGRWYNEAFDGIYLVKQQTTLKVGIGYPDKRVSVLDPALCPPNNGQADLYSKAFLSQFCLDSQTESSIAAKKDNHYFSTFRDQDIYLPVFEELYKTQKFYIPNTNVQDLN